MPHSAKKQPGRVSIAVAGSVMEDLDALGYLKKHSSRYGLSVMEALETLGYF